MAVASMFGFYQVNNTSVSTPYGQMLCNTLAPPSILSSQGVPRTTKRHGGTHFKQHRRVQLKKRAKRRAKKLGQV